MEDLALESTKPYGSLELTPQVLRGQETGRKRREGFIKSTHLHWNLKEEKEFSWQTQSEKWGKHIPSKRLVWPEVDKAAEVGKGGFQSSQSMWDKTGHLDIQIDEEYGSGRPRASTWEQSSVSTASEGVCKGIIYGGNKQALI